MLLWISTWGAVRRWWGSTWSILVTMSWKTYVDIRILQPVLIPGHHIPNFVTCHSMETCLSLKHQWIQLGRHKSFLLGLGLRPYWATLLVQIGYKLFLSLYHYGQFFALCHLLAIWKSCICLDGRLNLWSLPDNKGYQVVLDKMQRAVIKINIWWSEH